jgi:hypothetical protein
MEQIVIYHSMRKHIEEKFKGLPHSHIVLVNLLLSRMNPFTGIVTGITYNDLCEEMKIEPAPGRKNTGFPTKETIRNYIKSIEKICGDHFQVISEGQKLQFLFPDLPPMLKNISKNIYVNSDFQLHITQDFIEQGSDFNDKENTEINIEINTPNLVKNINKTNLHKQTQSMSCRYSRSKNEIGDDFYPSAQTIETAFSMGLTKVIDQQEIQAFIKHNKKHSTQWADFNPVFINWLERDAQYTQNKQQKAQGQLRSHHNERGTNQSTLNQTALERVSQHHGISIDSLWNSPSSVIHTGEFIEGTLIQPMDETNCNLRAAFY